MKFNGRGIRPLFFPALALVALACFGGAAHAAVITSVGSHLGLGNPAAANTPNAAAGWRTASVAKPLDIDGDNVYGSLGYVLFNPKTYPDTGLGQNTPLFNAAISLPAYLSVAATGANLSYNANYTTIDDPANPAGSPIYSGIGYQFNVSSSAESSLFSVTFATGTPTGATYRIGIFVDNIGPLDSAPVGLRITGASGDSGLVVKPQGVQVNNYYFFDIQNVAAGDVFEIIGKRANTGTGAVGLGGLTFDAIGLPEPASAALLALGAMMLSCRRSSHRFALT